MSIIYNTNKKNYKSAKSNSSLYRSINNDSVEYFETNKCDDNLKRLLCNNVLASGKCNYGDKCMYSHSLTDQKVDYNREKAYNLIRSSQQKHDIDVYDLENIFNDKELCRTLIQLTKTCQHCENGKCPGGYNCKYGVFDCAYQICYDDLCNDCIANDCKYVHMSNIGIKLKTEKNQKKKQRQFNISTKYSQYKQNIIPNTNYDQPQGTLLTDEFFSKQIQNINKDNDIVFCSDSDESYDRIHDYLNDVSNDVSYDESIFIFKTKEQ